MQNNTTAPNLCLRYPVLLVHGAFFRDAKWSAYWGGIPEALGQSRVQVFFGGQPSAQPVEDSARFLAERIRTITEETGCQKVNVIAHSKGGLDMRWAIAHCGVAERVASLTTVSTPHRGCRYVDHLLQKLPAWLVGLIAAGYNGLMGLLGEPACDFLGAVKALSSAECLPRDKALGLPQGVVCRSVGSCLPAGRAARGLLRMTHSLVQRHDGQNDGLVGTHSMQWGSSFHLLEPKGRRGISHWDATDLHRESLSGFDVPAYYVRLAADLQKQGL